MQNLFKVIDWVTTIGASLAAVMLGVIVAAFWIEVVSRYFFNAPTSWAQSTALYLVLASVMLMLPYLTREGHHVGMSMVFEVMPPPVARAFAIVLSIFSVAVCGVAAWICGMETFRQFDENVLTPDTVAFPLWWVTGFMIYGFAMAALHFARQAALGVVPKGMGG
ncbi:MAG: TRAP transporter small permease [Hyphomicrobiaceae bacterium]